MITNHTLISETLNSHFARIGLALKYNTEEEGLILYVHNYLHPLIPNSICLQPSTSSEIKIIIMGLKNMGEKILFYVN